MDANQWTKFKRVATQKISWLYSKEHIGQPFKCVKGGTVASESAVRFKVLLPLTAAQFLNHARNCFIEGFQDDERAIRQ